MGRSLHVYVAYGYDFGGPDDLFVEPQQPAWFDDGEENDDFISQAEELIEQALGKDLSELGLEFVFSGHVDYAGHLLIVQASERSTFWDALELDPAEFDQPRPEWDAMLNEVMQTLGLKPSQERPAWFAFASYG